jgi:hypothetical protein
MHSLEDVDSIKRTSNKGAKTRRSDATRTKVPFLHRARFNERSKCNVGARTRRGGDTEGTTGCAGWEQDKVQDKGQETS